MTVNPPTPYQWSVGDVGSAALLNAQLYTGLTYLLNPPAAYLYGTATTSIPNAGSGPFTLAPLATALLDPYSGFNAAGNKWTAPVAGWYELSGAAHFAANATGARACAFYVNGTSVTPTGSERWSAAAGTGFTSATAYAMVFLNVGDVVTMWCYQNSGGALALTVTGSCSCSLAIKFFHL